MITQKRLYLTADRSRVVEEGDPAAASLFAAKGTEIPDQLARKMGILESPQARAIGRPPEDKAVRVPRETKRGEK